MNISEPFIRKPVATTLLTIAIALGGAVAYFLLPVAPLPNVDFPTISVSASLPGGSPENMASSVATPLERQFAHIADVTEMTSTSSLGNSNVTLQFGLTRDINDAARDVQAAIQAARSYMPANLPMEPFYRKVNPADSPILILAMTSKVLTKQQVYNAADSIVMQKLSQINGVGQVIVGGGSLPAVRVELNPNQLNKYGIGLEQVRRTLMGATADTPKGYFSNGSRQWQVGANDQIFKAIDYKPLIIAYHNGSAVHISDVGQAIDSVQDIRNAGYFNGMPAIVVLIWRQPGANIISTVDRIRAALPYLRAAISPTITTQVMMDQSSTIRVSVDVTEVTVIIAVILVVLVVFLFLRSARTTFIPGIAVPVSIIATFAVMYLFGYSLDNLSLMALTICTGFVVDDAIVVTENISRYLEQGLDPFRAALKGAGEIGSTVFTISVSLVAVFIPLLLMGGIVGRLFHEFAVTLSAAILISMVVSLTATPMMCAHMLKPHEAHGWFYRIGDRAFNRIVAVYGKALSAILKVPAIMLAVWMAVVALTIFLYIHVPKGFFPEQDNGRVMGMIQADQDTSFQSMNRILRQMQRIVLADPNVSNVIGFTGSGGGGATLNTARMFIQLKPIPPRKLTAMQVVMELRPKLARVAGAKLYLQPEQNVRIGGHSTAAQYQYNLVSENLDDLNRYAPLMLQQLKKIRLIVDANSDQQNRGLESYVDVDRKTAARFSVNSQLIDDTLYDAFGEREVSTLYSPLNQYHVVMEVAPQYWQNPQTLRDVYVDSPAGQEVPLSAIAHFAPENAPLDVNHAGLFPSVTISFNLRPGVALGDAVNAINAEATKVGLPSTILTGFAGNAQAYQQSLSTEPLLIAAALVAVYLVLGILYESYIHPATILSTLPAAGAGALLAMMVTHTDLTVIAIIGIILLIGLVKKNGILMVDFAIAAERNEGKNSRDAIYEACMLRFRPIIMTTMAAILGAVPLAVGSGMGSELRRPLGIAIIGGLIVSQCLTLFSTPVIYLYFDRLQHWWDRVRGRSGAPEPLQY
ncbi:MAG TPA: efflux RND transporter permease subunit [Terriglobia bacterium]|nr:efflux RND transporter permease subunit [Terriglobia bacterium]